MVFFFDCIANLTWLLDFKLPISPIDHQDVITEDVLAEIPKSSAAAVVDTVFQTRNHPKRLTRPPSYFDHHMLTFGNAGSAAAAQKRQPKKKRQSKKSPKTWRLVENLCEPGLSNLSSAGV